MQLSSIIIPAAIFISPLVSLAIIFFKKDAILKWGVNASIGLFTVLFLISVWGLLDFNQALKMGFFVPLTLDPSGMFDFTLYLKWQRFLWIGAISLLLLSFFVYEKLANAKELSDPMRYFYLLLSALSASLSFLSDNVILSIFFTEMTLFFVYAKTLRDPHSELERWGYFRRGFFIFLLLVLVWMLNFVHVLDVKNLIVLAAGFYLFSFLFSRNTFAFWGEFFLFLVQAAVILFLFDRAVDSYTAEYIVFALSILFGVLSFVFVILSFFTNQILPVLFWLSLSAISYLVFVRFLSGYSQSIIWGGYIVMSLLVVFAKAMIVKYSSALEKNVQKAISVFFAFILLALFLGALPGLDVATQEFHHTNSIWQLTTLCLYSFIYSAAFTKMIFFKEKQGMREVGTLYSAWMPFLIVLLLQVGLTFFYIDNFSSSFDRFLAEIASSNNEIYHGSMFITILLGMIVGGILGVNKKFVSWANNKELKLEAFLPDMRLSISTLNMHLIESFQKMIAGIFSGTVLFFERLAIGVQAIDERVFSQNIPRNIKQGTKSLSMFVRYLHTGNIRFYFLIGAIICLFASLFFISSGASW